MALDLMLSKLTNQLKDDVIAELRDESISNLDNYEINPMISKHNLAKELRKSDTWIRANIFENPQYSTEIQGMLDEGLLQMKGYGSKTRVMVNKKAIKQFLEEHANELPWLEGA